MCYSVLNVLLLLRLVSAVTYFPSVLKSNEALLTRQKRGPPPCGGPFGCQQHFYQPQHPFGPCDQYGANFGYYRPPPPLPPPPPGHLGFGPPFYQDPYQSFEPQDSKSQPSVQSAVEPTKANEEVDTDTHTEPESPSADASAVAKSTSSGAHASATATANASSSSVNKNICILCRINKDH